MGDQPDPTATGVDVLAGNLVVRVPATDGRETALVGIAAAALFYR